MNKIDKFAIKLVHQRMKSRKVVDTASIFDLKKDNYNRLTLTDCVCSNGKPDKIFLWDGNEKDLMISFNGGGVTLKPEDCAYPMSFKGAVTNAIMMYAPDAEEIYEFSIFTITENNGIVSYLPENPFADWSKVMIPYVSGDFHVGDADVAYTDADGKEQTMRMHGYQNTQAILKLVKERWPDPERILITGSSAGSFGAAAYAKQIVDLYPNCDNITLYCDSSYIPMDNWDELMRGYWNTPEELIAPIHTEDLCGDWLEDLARARGDRVKILYACSTEDSVLSKVTNYEVTGKYKTTKKWRRKIKKGYVDRIARFEKAGLDVSWFVFEKKDPINGGTLHTISQDGKWAGVEVDGVSSAKWVMDAVNGKRYDVGLDLLK